MNRRRDPQTATSIAWLPETELVGLVLDLSPETDATLIPQYAIALHAWFLAQVQSDDPALSAALHDEATKKPFTLSLLDGQFDTAGRYLQLRSDRLYRWYVNALSRDVALWMQTWLQRLPAAIELRDVVLPVRRVAIAQPPTTYQNLGSVPLQRKIALSYITPTSFRHKGHHLPLPVPTNVFHSYLRRWNELSGMTADADEFLVWVDENVRLLRHQIQSTKVPAGKRGSVTGFTGSVEFGLDAKTAPNAAYEQLFGSLGQFAPYCGTGHKTTFGLGQTRLGWSGAPEIAPELIESTLLAERIEQLTDLLMQDQKRTGGQRALDVCQTRATILARREFGESLQAIALDLEMPYETVKTYAKLARRILNKNAAPEREPAIEPS